MDCLYKTRFVYALNEPNHQWGMKNGKVCTCKRLYAAEVHVSSLIIFKCSESKLLETTYWIPQHQNAVDRLCSMYGGDEKYVQIFS
jgi:hypothetical protein